MLLAVRKRRIFFLELLSFSIFADVTRPVLNLSFGLLRFRQTMTEVIGKVVSNNLETVLHATCRDQLIPAFDRGCQNVLGQVNETFQKGLNICEFAPAVSASFVGDHAILKSL